MPIKFSVGTGARNARFPCGPRPAQILKEWFREIDAREDAMAFPNIRRAPLTRFAIHLLLRKAVQAAMALLQAGVDLAVIAVWLGHESIETTNVYVHANLAMKKKALAKIQPMDTPFRRFRPDDRLLAFLEAL